VLLVRPTFRARLGTAAPNPACISLGYEQYPRDARHQRDGDGRSRSPRRRDGTAGRRRWLALCGGLPRWTQGRRLDRGEGATLSSSDRAPDSPRLRCGPYDHRSRVEELRARYRYRAQCLSNPGDATGAAQGPVLTIFHGVTPSDYRNAARILSFASDRVVVVSDAIGNRLQRAGLRGLDVTTIRNAVTPPILKSRSEIWGMTHRWRFVWHGWSTQSEAILLLDAWRHLPGDNRASRSCYWPGMARNVRNWSNRHIRSATELGSSATDQTCRRCSQPLT
jgi:hypothetical protein